MSSSSADRDPLELLAEEYLDRRRRGESPSVSEYAESYPDLADRIRDLFPALDLMEEADPGTEDLAATTSDTVVDTKSPRPEFVGDYRILREIGRGAMGVVYEAEQQSLGRRVALKVLPKSAATDARALSRFQSEARAAARLHHTNIVPVFEVGLDGETAFYAMQLIRGHSLDEVISELVLLKRHGHLQNTGSVSAQRSAAVSICRGQYVASVYPVGDSTPEPNARLRGETAPIDDALQSRDAQSDSGFRDTYYASVARIGEQVAEALHHAHERGTVHRDIKPSNLLIDPTGVVWVADFGLAKFEDDGHTRTGDIVGTLRYMSPERFKGTCDAKADVYSLGITLYEMLVLRPAFDASNQLELVDHISNVSPTRPRSLDATIPRDLETIVLKSIEKEPSARYQTAAEMGEDLRRYLNDEPIRARPLSLPEQFFRWARRRRAVASLAATVLVVLIGAVLVTSTMYAQTVREKENVLAALATVGKQKTDLQKTRDELEQQLYLADMRQVQQAYEDGNNEAAGFLLVKYLPFTGRADCRTWEWYYYWRKCNLGLRRVSTPTSWGFRGVAAQSPKDNTVFISGRWSRGGHFVSTVDMDSYELLEPISFESTTLVSAIAFIRAGAELAICNRRGELQLLDTASRTLRTANELPKKCTALAVESLGDNEVMAIGTDDGLLSLWDTTSWSLIQTLECERSVHCLAISPGGDKLIAGLWPEAPDRVLGDEGEPSARLWDTKTWREIPLSPKYTDGVISVVFSPNGNWLVTGTTTGKIHVLNAMTFELVATWDARKPVRSLAFSEDSIYLASGTDKDNAIRIWNMESLQLETVVKGHSYGLQTVMFLEDSQSLLSAGSDEVMIWNIEELLEESVIEGKYKKLAFRDKSGELIAVQPDDRIQRIDAARREKGSPTEISRAYRNVALSNDDKTMVAIGVTGEVETRSLKDLSVIRSIRIPNPSAALAVSSDGKCLAWMHYTEDGQVIVDVDSMMAGRKSFVGTRGEWDECFELSPDGRHLLVGTRLWDIASGERIRGIGGGRAGAAAFSPDGKLLAVGGWPGAIIIHRTSDWRQVAKLRGHTGFVTCLSFSHDSQLLASGAADDTVRVWDANLGELRAALKGHRGGVIDVCFSSNNQIIASSSHDGSIRLWTAASDSDVERDMHDHSCVLADVAKRYVQRCARKCVGDGDWKGAADCLTSLLRFLKPESNLWRETARKLGVIQVRLGNLDSYRHLCRQMLRNCENTADWQIAQSVAQFCLFCESGLDDESRAAAFRLAEFGMAEAKRLQQGGLAPPKNLDYTKMAKGIADYRRGQWASAIEFLEHHAKSIPDDSEKTWEVVSKAIDGYFVAMAYHRLGNGALAVKWLNQARCQAERCDTGGIGLDTQRIMCYVVQREAEKLIGGVAKKASRSY